jgi:hypothetical protein
MVDIFKGYFEEDFDEDSIRDNFTLVYELLDGESGDECCRPSGGGRDGRLTRRSAQETRPRG